MLKGKKSTAERIVYNAFERVEARLKKAPVFTHLYSLPLHPLDA